MPANAKEQPAMEVLCPFRDGGSYSAKPLQEALLKMRELYPAKSTESRSSPHVKKDDVKLIVDEFEISESEATDILVNNAGNLRKTLLQLVYVGEPGDLE